MDIKHCPDCTGSGLIWKDKAQVPCTYCDGKKFVGAAAQAAKRIERIGDATLYLGDCRDILPTLAEAGTIVSDPPYGGNIVRGHCTTKGNSRGTARNRRNSGVEIEGDKEPFDPRWLIERSSNVLLWGADHFYPRIPDSGRWLGWNKLGDLKPWDSFSDIEFAWHSRRGAARVFNWTWKGIITRRVPEDRNGRRDHPTIKPVALMKWCIEETESEGLVTDPYMGTGTTGVAAALLGRPFVGVESVSAYFDIACRRIEDAVQQAVRATRQGNLFMRAVPAPAAEEGVP